jgi:nitroreductase
MLNDASSALSLLQTRRSCRPRDLGAPGPSPTELRQILAIAARIPDHGKLSPWRFVHVPQSAREALLDLLERAYRIDNPEPGRLELEAVERFARQAPELIILVSAPAATARIPLWEQQLSCGAAGMNLLNAAHALGYAAGWVTGWATYSEEVRRAFATGADDRIAGFIFIGTPAVELEERVRPDLDRITIEWPAGERQMND